MERRLTERKRDALYAMTRAPLGFVPDEGWSNDHAGPFNTHTVSWLAGQGLCTIYDDGRAIITRAGRMALDDLEVAA